MPPIALENFILRYRDSFYRVRTSYLKVQLLRKYCKSQNISLGIYHSKKDGMSFEEFLELIGLKLNENIFTKFKEPEPYIDPEANFVMRKVWCILLGMLSIFFTIIYFSL
jgi:hypothetical protein